MKLFIFWTVLCCIFHWGNQCRVFKSDTTGVRSLHVRGGHSSPGRTRQYVWGSAHHVGEPTNSVRTPTTTGESDGRHAAAPAGHDRVQRQLQAGSPGCSGEESLGDKATENENRHWRRYREHDKSSYAASSRATDANKGTGGDRTGSQWGGSSRLPWCPWPGDITHSHLLTGSWFIAFLY